jgi:lipopolysaccharide export system protein LptA
MRHTPLSAPAIALAFILAGAGAASSAADGAKPAPAKPAAPAAKPGQAKGDSASLPSFGTFSITSKKEPIQITSEKLDFDYKNRRTVFHGTVEVVQGEVHLQSDVLTVDYSQVGDKQELKTVTADGHVTITQGPKKATGNHAVFDQGSRTMVMTGDALLEEGSNQVAGDKIVVYPDESRMEVLGENRRVKVVLFPGQGTLAAGASGAKDGSSPKTAANAAPAPTPQPDGASAGEKAP